jgi:endo-beta-N-acetylglucosaminidase D
VGLAPRRPSEQMLWEPHSFVKENNQLGNPCQNVVLEFQKRGKPSQSRKVTKSSFLEQKIIKFGIPAKMLFWDRRKEEDPRLSRSRKMFELVVFEKRNS